MENLNNLRKILTENMIEGTSNEVPATYNNVKVMWEGIKNIKGKKFVTKSFKWIETVKWTECSV